MLTPTIEPEDADDGAGEGICRYSDILVTLGYGPGYDEGGTTRDDARYYVAHTNIATTGINTDVMVFEPMSHNDGGTGEGGDDGAEAIILIAQH